MKIWIISEGNLIKLCEKLQRNTRKILETVRYSTGAWEMLKRNLEKYLRKMHDWYLREPMKEIRKRLWWNASKILEKFSSNLNEREFKSTIREIRKKCEVNLGEMWKKFKKFLRWPWTKNSENFFWNFWKTFRGVWRNLRKTRKKN